MKEDTARDRGAGVELGDRSAAGGGFGQLTT
jgi:hypothetical protein